MIEPIYKIRECKSNIEDSGDWSSEKLAKEIAEAIKETSAGYALCWLHYAVLVGKVTNGILQYYDSQQPDYPRHLLRMRIFNEERESHIWRSDPVFKYRKRSDGRGEVVEYVEAVQPLWGTQAAAVKNAPDWSRIFEARGTEIIVPFAHLSLNETQRLSIVTRNYINSSGQAGYVDCRFVKFDVPGGQQ